MTAFFNFRQECLYKYDQEIYDLFMDSFDQMPLCCVVNGKFLAVHGGISPEFRSVNSEILAVLAHNLFLKNSWKTSTSLIDLRNHQKSVSFAIFSGLIQSIMMMEFVRAHSEQMM